jgi:hypothetical protein
MLTMTHNTSLPISFRHISDQGNDEDHLRSKVSNCV